MFRKLICLLRSKSGVATSLLEATATIAVGATLAGAAVGVVTDKIQDARIAQAQVDVQALADAMNTFEKDNLFYPIFAPVADTKPTATNRAEGATTVELLKSKRGDSAEVVSTATTLPASALNSQDVLDWSGNSTFGTSGSGTGDPATDHDTLESQLNENTPQYTLKGGFSFDKNRGFAGPYLGSLAPTDPWGNRYESNVAYLDDLRLTDSTTKLVKTFQTIVISAGPNERMQTPFQATPSGSGNTGSNITIVGDDIAYRVR